MRSRRPDSRSRAQTETGAARDYVSEAPIRSPDRRDLDDEALAELFQVDADEASDPIAVNGSV